MVQLAHFEEFRPQSEKATVKLEIEDPLEEYHGPLNKKSKLAKRPLFFRETNPQPRKHTLWQATSDFTNGQASMHRLMMSGYQDHVSISATSTTYAKNETGILIGRLRCNVPQETLSPSSVMDARVTEENPTTSGTKEPSNDSKTWDQIKVPGLRSSMSMSDLVNHIGHCISGQTDSGNPLLPPDSSLNKPALEELTQYLLTDSQVNSASDEQSVSEEEVDIKPSMSRKESYGELLMHLPRIASMPFLFNIAEDSENQAV